MAPLLYIFPPSPPVRAVQMTVKTINLTLTEKPIDPFEGEQLRPEYLKLNPQHTLPTLVEDNGFALWDSHAIMTYLVSKYAKDDALYPKDLETRAIVDQRLHFESSVLASALRNILVPVFFEGKTKVDEKDKEKTEVVYGFLEAFLEDKKWIAGNFLSIADFSILASISSLSFLVPIDGKKFSRLDAWYKRVDGLPVAEINRKGVQEHIKLIQPFLKD